MVMTRSRPSRRPAINWTGKTTVMMRNIPSTFTQKTLLREVCAHGFAGKLDYFYLPMDFATSASSGYAFINFVDTESVAQFRQVYEERDMQGPRPVQVVPATTQGFEANYAHFAHSAVFNHHRTEHAPLFIRQGKLLNKAGATSTAAVAALVRGLPARRALQVAGIPTWYTHGMLFVELANFGVAHELEALYLPTDEETGTSCGTGYAVFRAEEAATAARQGLDGAELTLAAASKLKVDLVQRPRAPRAKPAAGVAFEYSVPSKPLQHTPQQTPQQTPRVPPSMPCPPPPQRSSPATPEFSPCFTGGADAQPLAPPVPPSAFAWDAFAPTLGLGLGLQYAAEPCASLREQRGASLGRFAALDVDVEERAQDRGTLTPAPLRWREHEPASTTHVDTPPRVSLAPEEQDSTPGSCIIGSRGASLVSKANPFAMPRLLPSPSNALLTFDIGSIVAQALPA